MTALFNRQCEALLDGVNVTLFPENKSHVPLFPRSNISCYISMFPETYVLELMFLCSLKITGNVPLFPKSKWSCSPVPPNP